MFEKEAEDFLKKSLKVDNDEFDFFKNEASCKEEIKRLTDFIEPREKRIEELEKEKCELLGIIQGKDKVIQELKKELNSMLVSKNQQLTKAKEIIKDYMIIAKGSHTTVCGVTEENRTIHVLKLNEEAEQFLNGEVYL